MCSSILIDFDTQFSSLAFFRKFVAAISSATIDTCVDKLPQKGLAGNLRVETVKAKRDHFKKVLRLSLFLLRSLYKVSKRIFTAICCYTFNRLKYESYNFFHRIEY